MVVHTTSLQARFSHHQCIVGILLQPMLAREQGRVLGVLEKPRASGKETLKRGCPSHAVEGGGLGRRRPEGQR